MTADDDDQTVALTPEELEVALALLESEERPSRRFQLLLNLIGFIAAGAFYFCLPLGLLIIWFNSTWGLWLLIAGAVSFAILGTLGFAMPARKTRSLRRALEETNLAKAATDLWRKRAERSTTALGFVVIGAVVLAIAGFVVLLVRLSGSHEVSVLGLTLIGAPALVMWSAISVTSYQEFAYYASLSEARSRLSSLAHTEDKEVERVNVSSEDMDVIARAERQHVQRKVEEIAEQEPRPVEGSYALVQTPGALESLESIANSPQIWESVRDAVYSLQENPHPPEADRVNGGPTLRLTTETHALFYVVDETTKRVVILAITPREPSNAS